jgi:hypothetical protein
MKTRILKTTSLVMGFCALMLLGSLQSHAQTVIYDQSFNAAYPNWPTGWSSSSNKGWVMDTSVANESYVWNNTNGYSFASGGAMVDIANPDNGDTGTYTLTSIGISTLGYDSITATFGARLTKHFADSGSVIKSFEWSSYTGGTWGSWNAIPFTQVNNNSNWYVINDSVPMALPTAAAGQDSIKFLWVAFIHSNTSSGSPSGTFRFDDFIVAGDTTETTGINIVNTVSPVSLYPNPASNFVIINNPSGNNYMVRLTDVTGKILKTVYISNNQNKIDVSDFAPGFYMAQLISSDTNEQAQVIKLVVIR